MNDKSAPDSSEFGRNSDFTGSGIPNNGISKDGINPDTDNLLIRMVESGNMMQAYRKVLRNKGRAGIDDMTVFELKDHMNENWAVIKKAILNGTYIPQPVLRVEIPKPNGKGVRLLGIPTVTDRLIQQAIHQILNPIFDKGFSNYSFGFRSGKSAHQAVLKVKEFATNGKRWVVDLDLEKFFDKVNHDVLMSRIARKVKDRDLLKLIRRYLKAGIMLDGIITVPRQGTPQGSPLSPLLSNIILDDLDKELERRNLDFCRYADDCNIYVGSKRAGERILSSITLFIEKKLRLKVNQEKTKVDRPWKRVFLGYSLTINKMPKLRIPAQSVRRLKYKVKEICRKGKGWRIEKTIATLKPILRGWFNYFRLTDTYKIFETLDGWLRRRLRSIIWRQWGRNFTRFKKLRKLGISTEQAKRSAFNGRGRWWNSGKTHMHQAFPKRYFDSLGLYSFVDNLFLYRNSMRTAVVRNRMPGGVRGG